MPTTAKKSKRVTPAQPASSAKTHDSVLEEFFIDCLKDIYYAEKALTKAMPKFTKAATSEELKAALTQHLEVTKNQVKRLEEVFTSIGRVAKGKKCEAIEGLIKEAESIIEDTDEGTATRDVGIILASQKVEHYEIASYGGLAQLAKTLGFEEAGNLLGQTLQEEKDTDSLLTTIAESSVNYEAIED